MSSLRFDSIGGASGNMILGSLLAAGTKLEAVRRALASLPLTGFTLEAEEVVRNNFKGIHVSVSQAADTAQPHRHLSDVTGIIEAGTLSGPAKALSMAVFEKLAHAEAAVHGTTPDKIHFHEVGAVDAIVDIVGASVAVDLLGIETVEVGPLPLGQGTTTCAHGVMPLPVPAVAQLLAGHPVIQTDEPHELVTPTGAALLMTLKERFPSQATSRPAHIAASGYGFGTRTLASRMNVLRATILVPSPIDTATDSCLVLECNLDDITPEMIGSLTTRLISAGALDVFTTAVQMKKQRPGTLLTVLCTPELRDAMLDLVFRESTTFGIREYETRRTTLERRFEDVTTPHGQVRVKIGTWKGHDITRMPEYEDCARLAGAAGIPVRAVYEAALREL